MWKALFLVCLSFFVCACENGTIEYRGKDIQGTYPFYVECKDCEPVIKCFHGVAYWSEGGGLSVMFDTDGKVVQCRKIYYNRNTEIDK